SALVRVPTAEGNLDKRHPRLDESPCEQAAFGKPVRTDGADHGIRRRLPADAVGLLDRSRFLVEIERLALGRPHQSQGAFVALLVGFDRGGLVLAEEFAIEVLEQNGLLIKFGETAEWLYVVDPLAEVGEDHGRMPRTEVTRSQEIAAEETA